MTTEQDCVNYMCQTPMWSSAASFNNICDTFDKFKTLIDQWSQWKVEDIVNLADNITILPTSSFNNGVMICNFTKNGKNGTAYGWARPKGMTTPGPCVLPFNTNGKVVFIVPQSGNNEADKLISNTSSSPILYNTICSFADGLIHVLPSKDFNCICAIDPLNGGFEFYSLYF